MAEADKVLKEVFERLTPAVLELAARGENGSIVLEFRAGEFKGAKKTVSI